MKIYTLVTVLFTSTVTTHLFSMFQAQPPYYILSLMSVHKHDDIPLVPLEELRNVECKYAVAQLYERALITIELYRSNSSDKKRKMSQLLRLVKEMKQHKQLPLDSLIRYTLLKPETETKVNRLRLVSILFAMISSFNDNRDDATISMHEDIDVLCDDNEERQKLITLANRFGIDCKESTFLEKSTPVLQNIVDFQQLSARVTALVTTYDNDLKNLVATLYPCFITKEFNCAQEIVDALDEPDNDSMCLFSLDACQERLYEKIYFFFNDMGVLGKDVDYTVLKSLINIIALIKKIKDRYCCDEDSCALYLLQHNHFLLDLNPFNHAIPVPLMVLLLYRIKLYTRSCAENKQLSPTIVHYLYCISNAHKKRLHAILCNELQISQELLNQIHYHSVPENCAVDALTTLYNHARKMRKYLVTYIADPSPLHELIKALYPQYEPIADK